jgi:type IV fimbrial biogenesis protein FimT
MGKNKLVQNTGGFTLIELMATIGIMAVVMAIAVPSFLSFLPSLRLADAARQIATDLQQVRMKAIAQNTAYQVNFSASTYSVQKCSGSCTNDSGNIVLPDGISIVSASVSPQFQPRGTAAAAAAITLTNGATQKWVCVRSVGRVSVQDSICS